MEEGGFIKPVNGVLRILSTLIDYIIIMVPIQLIMLGVFQVSQGQADLLFKLLFAVYGVLLMEYMQGATLGKWFGKTMVITIEGCKPTLLEYGMRELSKSLYFIPYIGFVLIVINCLFVFRKDGRTIHDYVAHTKVIYVWQKEEALYEPK